MLRMLEKKYSSVVVGIVILEHLKWCLEKLITEHWAGTVAEQQTDHLEAFAHR
jgi:hypothetical protein